MKKLLASLLIAAMSCTLLTGCGSGKGSASAGGTKLFLSYTTDDFRQAFADAASAEAQAQGVTLTLSPNDTTVEAQVASIKKAVADGATAILCIPANASTAQELEVAANGVPIIFCNSKPDEDYMKADKYIYVGSSEEQAGQFQAERLIANNPGKTSFDIVMFKGQKNHSGAVGRENGFKNTMKDNGIATYMKNHGIDTSAFPVFGVDATADGIAALEDGRLAFTVYQSAKGQGSAAVLAGIALSKGQSVKDIEGVDSTNTYIYVPFEPVDKSNAANYK